MRSMSHQTGALREAKPRGFQTGGFPTFFGKVLIVSRTLSGIFCVGEREKGQSGKISENTGQKSREKIGKVTKRTNQDGQVQIGKPPVGNPHQQTVNEKFAKRFRCFHNVVMPRLGTK